MKITVRVIVSWTLLLFSALVFADFKMFVVDTEEDAVLPRDCVGSNQRIQLKAGIVEMVESSGEVYRVGLDKQLGSLPIYIGSEGNPALCVLAFKYAENDVNETYAVFVFDPKAERYSASRIGFVTNPDFSSGLIKSNYKDGPVTYNDNLCFSKKNKDYYLCGRREQFTENLEKAQKCGELQCASSSIVKEGTNVSVSAVVISSKASLFKKEGASHFQRRNGYLVLGDEVVLTDFGQGESGLYYQVDFRGRSIGWIFSGDLRVND
jgi:hypothetical protein